MSAIAPAGGGEDVAFLDGRIDIVVKGAREIRGNDISGADLRPSGPASRFFSLTTLYFISLLLNVPAPSSPHLLDFDLVLVRTRRQLTLRR